MIARRNIVAGVVVLAAMAMWLLVGRKPPAGQPPIATAHRIDRPPALRSDPSLLASGSISGTVRAGTGESITNARVCVGLRHSTLDSPLRCADTDAGGAYTVAVDVTSRMIAASAPGFRPRVQELGDLTPGQDLTVDLTLEVGGAKLTGTVEDLGGGPIVHAMISLSTIATETDDRGQFTVWTEPGIETWVTTTADGYGTRSIRCGAPSRVLILLAPESTIRGRAIDAVTNAPIAGARVVLSGGASTWDATTTASDEHGEFTFDQVAYGTYKIDASAARSRGGAGSFHVGIGQHVDDVVVRMLRAHQLDVRVTSKATCPHPSVSLQERDRLLTDPWRDADGWFHFDGVRPGRYLGSVSCDGVEQTHPYGPVVVADDDVRVEWGTERLATIRGVVRWRRGGPVEDAELELRSPIARARERRAEHDGSYEISGLAAGRYRVMATAEDHKTDWISFDVRGGETASRDLVLDGEPRGTDRGTLVDDQAPHPLWEIRGTVVNAADRPVPDAIVVATTGGARFYSPEPFTDQERPVTTRADGSFTLSVEPTYNVTSSVRLHAYVVGGGEATAIATLHKPVTLRLPSLGSVEGRVTRADGSIPERVRILVRGGATVRSETFYSQGGRFAIRDLPVSSSLTLSAEVDHVEHPISISLAAGESKTGVDITVPTVATITGRVVDLGNGAPLPGTRLLLHVTFPGGSVWITHDDQLTGEDGRFAISGVPPGRLAIEGIPPGDMWSRFDHVAVIDHTGNVDIGDLGVSRTP